MARGRCTLSLVDSSSRRMPKLSNLAIMERHPRNHSHQTDNTHSLVTDQPGGLHKDLSSSPKRSFGLVSSHGILQSDNPNFLMSDSLDENFERIHESHAEILNHLQLLDSYTQQTQMDVNQLFDRLKNNNQHLSTLLSSIAEYSREVTEDGSATKTDVSKILNALKELRGSSELEELTKRLGEKQEEMLEELRSFPKIPKISAIEEKLIENHTGLINRLQDIQVQLGGLKVQNTFGEFRSRVESLAQENSKEVNSKLAEVLTTLQLLNTERRFSERELEDLTDEISRQVEGSSERFENLLDFHTTTIKHTLTSKLSNLNHSDGDWKPKQAELLEQFNNLSEKYSNLKSSYTDLESRYSELESRYDQKVQLFVELQSNFAQLGEDSKNLELSIGELDLTKFSKVQELHSRRMRQPRNVTPLQRQNRISSMPLQHQNNSDLEEW